MHLRIRLRRRARDGSGEGTLGVGRVQAVALLGGDRGHVQEKEVDRPRGRCTIDSALLEQPEQCIDDTQCIGSESDRALCELREPWALEEDRQVGSQYGLHALTKGAPSRSVDVDLGERAIEDERPKPLKIVDVGIERRRSSLQRRCDLAKAHAVGALFREQTKRLGHDPIAAEGFFLRATPAAHDLSAFEGILAAHAVSIFVTNAVRQADARDAPVSLPESTSRTAFARSVVMRGLTNTVRYI